MMRKTIRKWFWAWDFDKEERWLNEMAAKGLVLNGIGYCKYTFDECAPGEYNVRVELLDNVPTHAESQQYIKFIEDTGAEYLGSIMRWVYFRKRTDTGEFNLYSDNASRIRHLNRVITLITPLGFVNICTGFANFSIYFGSGTRFNIYTGALCFGVGLLMLYGALRVYLKKRGLQKLQNLFE